MSKRQLIKFSDALSAFNIEESLTEIDIKKSQIAADMCALLCYLGINRAQLAEKLGISKSRVSNILSGEKNLTIESICNFSNALGFDFDVVFFNEELPPPRQPWQIISDNEIQNINPIREEFLRTSCNNMITITISNNQSTDNEDVITNKSYSSGVSLFTEFLALK